MKKLKKNIILYPLIVLLNFFCSSKADSNSWENSLHKIFVAFRIDEKGIDLKNNFKVLFSVENKIMPAKVIGNQIRLPIFPVNIKVIDVIFIFADHELRFNDFELAKLSSNQNVNWVFIKKNKPFEEFSSSDIQWSKVKEMHYWQLIPLEEGEGVEVIEPVY